MVGTIIPPAILYIGQHATTNDYIIRYLQSIYCQQNNDRSCDICVKIKNKQHDCVYFVNNSENIKIEQIENLLHIIQYQREKNIPFFFVLYRVDFLSSACANRLLKILEEMPSYYHFIFSATRENLVQDTIKSRCFKYFTKDQQEISPQNNLFFCDKKIYSAEEFEQFLERYSVLLLSDHLNFFNKILEYWSLKYKITLDTIEKENAYKKIAYMQTLLSKKIPEGSFTLIARDMYIQWLMHDIHD